jgi:hypothetical protein
MIKLMRRHIKVALAVISGLAGAVVGAAFQYLLTDFNPWITIVGLLGLAVSALGATQVAVTESRAKADESISAHAKSIAQSVQESQQAQRDRIADLASRMKESVDVLVNQFGLRVERLLVSDTDNYSSVAEDSSAQMIFSAESELLILDLLADDGGWPDDAMNQILLDQAFAKIIELVEAPQSQLTYKRIIQVPDPAIGLLNIKNGNLLRHCHDILRVRGRGTAKKRAVLRVAKQRFPFKFVLIDQTKLILQLQQYSDGQKLSLWGELQIADPSRNLIAIFRQIWDEIDYDDETRNARLTDLPPCLVVEAG